MCTVGNVNLFYKNPTRNNDDIFQFCNIQAFDVEFRNREFENSSRFDVEFRNRGWSGAGVGVGRLSGAGDSLT